MTPEKLLQHHNLRKTNSRLSVLQSFLNSRKALSHSELQQLTANKVDRVSLYRILESFEQHGILHKVPDDQVSVKYALCDHPAHEVNHTHSDNHAHFKCETCGDTLCLEDAVIPEITVPKGFQVKEKFMLLGGLCEHCAN
jgi:Fur family ferric uptake transcriptional regulator